jgi:hypothetical protein
MKIHTIQIGEKVWLELKHLKLCHKSKKLALKHEGPFLITELLNTLNYHLSLPNNWHIYPVLHASLLPPYKENDVHGDNFTEPPLELVEGEPEYEVESIVSHQRNGRGFAYLVKWKGYSTGENTWEPEHNLQHAPELL